MDLQLVKKGLLDYTRRKKRLVLLLTVLGFSSYGAYKAYNFPSIAAKRRKVSKLLGVLATLAEVVSDTAETVGVVSRDFKDFLQSESDQIPNSLKQISKIARSVEFSGSVVSLTQALTAGILRGYQYSSRTDNDVSGNGNPSFLDQVFDKLATPAGSGFVSVVVGSFARNLVMGFYQDGEASRRLNSNLDLTTATTANHVGSETNSMQQLVDVVCGDKCKDLIGDCVQLFVSTAVAVYLDKTMHINPYNDMIAGLTNPKHEREVRDVLVSVCNGAVETLVKTSHQVLTSADPNPKPGLGSPYSAIDEREDAKGNELSMNGEYSSELKSRNSCDEVKENGWVSKVSSTLAVPSNRRLVLDVTGRVTFETVRSFLEFLMEKVYGEIQRCVATIYEVVVDSGLEFTRYVSAKSSVAVTVWLSLCLHVLDGAWILVPA